MIWIRHTVASSSLGFVSIAATDAGIRAIAFGDDADALTGELRMRLPDARLRAMDAEFEDWVRRVCAYIERPAGALDVPLDPQGTAFQRLVWEKLRSIAAGRTAAYAEIAASIGRPAAARAVARACATNAIAVAIPCHRVVAAGGGLSGYRWGPARKAELLRRERAA
jgi:AraC family transcriptional regulator of adaptative response/methylated-DNA-[protein]-cysteine methyltransferase